MSDIGDNYILGVVAYHTGLTDIIKLQLAVEKGNEKQRLFDLGNSEGADYPLCDIAAELWKMRHNDTVKFDRVVTATAGTEKFRDILATIEAYKPDHTTAFKATEELRLLRKMFNRISREHRVEGIKV